jgi:hypothetical protein
LSEKANAFAALKRLQCQFDLSDVELTFIAEYRQKEPDQSRVHSAQVSEHPLNPFEVILGLFETHHIFLSLMQQIAVVVGPAHACA